MKHSLLISIFCNFVSSLAPPSKQHGQPFLKPLNSSAWVIGNDIWNVTIGQTFGTKLMYKGYDLVGQAVGHYVSYNGAASNLNWTSAKVHKKSGDYTDIVFTANEGDMHWVLTPTLFGAYQYFVNRALPVLGEFRTLWRLDNTTFTIGKDDERDEELPPLAVLQSGERVQDETWQLSNGSYITKYDFATFLPSIEGNLSYWGVYGKLNGTGESIGSWYIHGGKDYFNGDHLKQELMVHRESATGDAVQLNMIHGTHFMYLSRDAFPVGKTWGPWLWYMNDGSAADAAARSKEENAAWPYSWFEDDHGFHSRGSISGQLALSDGRPASGAAVFLGDNNPDRSSLDQGAEYYYRVYADEAGRFGIANVRAGSYGLQAWANGGALGDVTTAFSRNDTAVRAGENTELGSLVWEARNRTRVWQMGSFDRLASGFGLAGPPHEHARFERCQGNITYVIGESQPGDWCYAQSEPSRWTVEFDVAAVPEGSSAAVLTVSIAGYASGSTGLIYANGVQVGSLRDLQTSQSLYRSATLAGEWQLVEVDIADGVIGQGRNSIVFDLDNSARWRGWMWDTVLLEWK